MAHLPVARQHPTRRSVLKSVTLGSVTAIAAPHVKGTYAAGTLPFGAVDHLVPRASSASIGTEAGGRTAVVWSSALYHLYCLGVEGVKVLLLGVFFLAIGTINASPRTQLDELIARAKSLELDTPYVPPPGDPLVHHAAGYAKVMCSAVFMTGLPQDFAAENVGFFTAPYEMRKAW
jgi:hypothetical protein